MPRSPRRPAPTGASRRTAPRLEAMSFPHQRPRRLRQSAALRRLVAERPEFLQVVFDAS